jgi:4,5-epoxidase
LNKAAVLIAGAGPTGLALACDLRMRGIDAQVLDRMTAPAVTTRALGLQPRGRQILDRLGALGDLPHMALPQSGFSVYVEGRLALRVELASLQGPNDDGPLRAPQTAIEERLRARFASLHADVLWGHDIVEAREDGGALAVRVRVEHGEKLIRADWLIGCDGAHSACRRIIGADFAGSEYPQTFLLGDVRLSEARAADAAIYLRGREMLSMASLPDGAWRIGTALPPDDPLTGKASLTADRDKSSTSMEEGLARLQELYSTYSGDRVTRLSDPTWFSVFRIHRHIASMFRRGRVLIAGDAAHLTSPLGGQGMNTGLNDAFNLGWKLALVVNGRADESLIDTYEAERRPAVERIDRATAAWTNVLFAQGVGGRFLRRYIALPAMRLKLVQAWTLTRRGSLQSRYRGGPLAPKKTFPSLFLSGPQPGDGAPGVPCRRSDGVETSTGREIGPNWGLIVFGPREKGSLGSVSVARKCLGQDLRVFRVVAIGDPAGPADEPALVDERGAITRAFGARRGSIFLIRPDGHLAWRSRGDDPQGLRDWLNRVLGLRDSSDIARSEG